MIGFETSDIPITRWELDFVKETIECNTENIETIHESLQALKNKTISPTIENIKIIADEIKTLKQKINLSNDCIIGAEKSLAKEIETLQNNMRDSNEDIFSTKYTLNNKLKSQNKKLKKELKKIRKEIKKEQFFVFCLVLVIFLIQIFQFYRSL